MVSGLVGVPIRSFSKPAPLSARLRGWGPTSSPVYAKPLLFEALENSTRSAALFKFFFVPSKALRSDAPFFRS